MGRLSSLGKLGLGLVPSLVTAGCEDTAGTTAPQSRAAAVQAKPQPSAPPSAAARAPSAEDSPPRPILCEGQLGGKGIDLPESDISRAGTPAPPEAIEAGGGKWTWINFWAAWCVPCKEEIPRLRGWEKKLEGSLRLRFVSLDDDERQLESFLSKQPAGGLQATYWLRDGKEREEWMTALGMDPDPELPAHLLVDPAGKVRCKIQGAVEDDDYARVSKLVGG